MSKKAKRVINGTYGAVWINGEKLFDLNTFEAKVVLEYEDVTFPEDTATHKKFISWAGEGTLGVKKMFTRGALLLKDLAKKGIAPDIEITTRLADPDAYGVERTKISEVTFTEFLLAKIEQKTVLTEELPFNFADFDLLETIKTQEGFLAAA